MKTHILELEPGDDLISVRDRMGWSNSSRILLVWPAGKMLLDRKMDLVLLQRRSQELGAQLGFVCKDSGIHRQSFQLGIPVFKTLKKAQNDHWRIPHRYRNQIENQQQKLSYLHGHVKRARPLPLASQNDRPMNEPLRLLFFTFGIFALLALAATMMPTALVTVNPKNRHQEIIFEAYTDDLINATSLLGAVPSEQVDVDVEGRDSIEVSGSIFLPYKSAAGKVVFRNLSDQEVEIPEGTVVRTSDGADHRYRTVQVRVVPAGTNQTISVDVISLTPGTQGNLPAGAINAIEGNLGTLLSASNPEAIVGGTDRQEPVPADLDRIMLSDRLESTLQETAKAEIMTGLSPDDMLLEITLKVSKNIEEQFEPAGEDPTDTLALTCHKRYEARVVRFIEMQKLILAVLDANKPEGYDPQVNSFEFEILESPHFVENNRIAWTVWGKRTLQASINPSHLIQISMGLSPSEASDRIEREIPLENAPEISLRPAWWPVMPILPFRIEIQTLPAEGVAPVEVSGS